jgi:tRNA (guanine-N7-)-methyltransferase
MARRNKLIKFTELLTFPNVYENYDPQTEDLTIDSEQLVKMKSLWKEKHFKNDNPIILELACGRGEYSLVLAERYPDKNFIGIDIKGARIWQGAKIALEAGLNNVAFLRTKIEFCPMFFGPEEVDEIWITFPDPFLKSRKYNRRLTSPNYLKSYNEFLKKDGLIHLKTDSDALYEHSLEVLEEEGHQILVDDYAIYTREKLVHPDLDIKTYYENRNISNAETIKYLQFKLNY